MEVVYDCASLKSSPPPTLDCSEFYLCKTFSVGWGNHNYMRLRGTEFFVTSFMPTSNNTVIAIYCYVRERELNCIYSYAATNNYYSIIACKLVAIVLVGKTIIFLISLFIIGVLWRRRRIQYSIK